ncbi:MAG: hypothetical protein C0183_19145 [Roseiflexus castenholzii]|nr:MAG: hypothetical protein C0183_19145 [Roseiflexus castenholzii]
MQPVLTQVVSASVVGGTNEEVAKFEGAAITGSAWSVDVGADGWRHRSAMQPGVARADAVGKAILAEGGIAPLVVGF